MKGLLNYEPDSWIYTAMLNIYWSGGSNTVEMFEEMTKLNVPPSVMRCTCLIQCLGRSKRIADLARVYQFATARGVKRDDKLCEYLLSVVSYCKRDGCRRVFGTY